jgi:hypothetical protein
MPLSLTVVSGAGRRVSPGGASLVSKCRPLVQGLPSVRQQDGHQVLVAGRMHQGRGAGVDAGARADGEVLHSTYSFAEAYNTHTSTHHAIIHHLPIGLHGLPGDASCIPTGGLDAPVGQSW